MAERSEAKSAKRSFASKYFKFWFLTRSFASRFLLRSAQPFLAKFKLPTNWSLSQFFRKIEKAWIDMIRLSVLMRFARGDASFPFCGTVCCDRKFEHHQIDFLDLFRCSSPDRSFCAKIWKFRRWHFAQSSDFDQQNGYSDLLQRVYLRLWVKNWALFLTQI